MALVMLPCELPWWESVQSILSKLLECKNTTELIEGMQNIHNICNVSLDPDEDLPDPEQFIGLLNFLDNDINNDERSDFLRKTLPNIIKVALRLKELKPTGGLHFSLQQQSDCTELSYTFVSSLLANAFFSTFPKRTAKSHPTLQNFNFCNFFKHLTLNSQKAKLRSILHYFTLLGDDECDSEGSLRIFRQVMSSKEWLTIEDWLECSLPLCQLQIKQEGRLERSDNNSVMICFASSRIGGDVLGSGNSQECITMSTFPEMLITLLNVESLEDNEVLTVEMVRNVSRILDPKHKLSIEKFDRFQQRTLCCMDAEDYSTMSLGQYEEDNILRELNKSLLGFQQKHLQNNDSKSANNHNSKRLPPIGESNSSSYSDTGINIPMITQQSCSTNRSSLDSLSENNKLNKLAVQKAVEVCPRVKERTSKEGVLNNRRGKFIVLGSSGECLPVTRRPESQHSVYSSLESSEEEFLSAKTSLDGGSEEDDSSKIYSKDLNTQEKRNTFAQRLREALKRETSSTTPSSDSSNYAVDIAVTGSDLEDQDIKLRRGGSGGFMLREETLDEDFLNISLQQEREWIDKFRSKQSNLSKKDSSKSSDYSFSTEYSSDLEEVYDQFSRWLENPIIETEKGTKKELDPRDMAVVQFAGSLLKRTLSESFAGVPFAEGFDNTTSDFIENKKNKLVLNAKSLSLELARQRHRLAAQLSERATTLLQENRTKPVDSRYLDESSDLTLKSTSNQKRKNWALSYATVIVQTLEDICVNVVVSQENLKKLSQISEKPLYGIKPVTTGNWGCGSSRKGSVQLKVIIQWLAASVANIPVLIYYTAGHPELAYLDTVCRILKDRKWSVKDLAQIMLRYSSQVMRGKNANTTLFEEIIGMERSA